MCLSENIRYLRKKMNLSQEELADKLGYKSYTTIQKWESGVADPPLKSLGKMSKIFSIDMDTLTGKRLMADAERFAETAEAFNKANPHLPTPQEKAHMAKYRKLNDENKTKVDNYTDQVLRLQAAEDEVLLQAAHREMEFDKDAHEHDMEIIKDL